MARGKRGESVSLCCQEQDGKERQIRTTLADANRMDGEYTGASDLAQGVGIDDSRGKRDTRLFDDKLLLEGAVELHERLGGLPGILRSFSARFSILLSAGLSSGGASRSSIGTKLMNRRMSMMLGWSR